jgi:glycosyltransferase involved in cell wall biosynthesis
MDVEFWEIEVIKGGRNTITKDRPVMMVETHGKRNEELVRNFFKDHSFSVEELDIRNPLNYHFLLKPGSVNGQEPVISTVLLSFNRLDMLKRTVESYLSTISVPYELIIVDNASTDGSRDYIQEICNGKPNHKAILLEKDEGGGEAINLGIELTHGKYIHVSENDIEYFAGWDREMIRKFEAFPALGQISPKSISPGAKQVPNRLTNGNETILAVDWITSTSIFRREIWSWGARWRSIENKPGSKYRPPGDVKFSFTVGKLGYLIAWNDKNMVANMGFRFKEIIKNIDYYVENYRSKYENGMELLRETLSKKGYELVEDNGKYRAVLKGEAQKTG